MNLIKMAAGLASGLLFGAGLAVAGMTNPNKVLNFLDLAHGWDPSLALVMAAAIPVSAAGFWLARQRSRPLFELEFALPSKRNLEAPLLIGSALFGVGWGLGGYCPGPAVASLSHANGQLFLYLTAMLAGFLLAALVARRLVSRGERSC